MMTLGRFVCAGILSGVLFVPMSHAQNPPTTSGQADQDNKTQAGTAQTPLKKLTKDQQKKLMKELDNSYKVWLDEDVPYIITDAERSAFLQLSTNEERENFIENFWLRRDPTPDTPENEFKEEHYRRIEYADEHFASGIPGWKTDRGRIYIIWGPPDNIESHASGGFYQRSTQEGGGETTTFPFEDWHYNYLEGLGNNINLEFVDESSTNEYHLSTDPEDKDALLYVPGAGLSDLENEGLADKSQRFQRNDGTHMPTTIMDMNTQNSEQNDEFSRYELAAKIFVAPPVKFKDLSELVTARIVRNQLPFQYGFSFLKVTSDSVMVPISIELNNREISFQEKNGVHVGTLNIFGRVSTIGGRVVQTFEDTMSRDFPDTLFQQYLTKKSIYGKTLPLRPGLYRLDIVLKDVQSGNVGIVSTRLAVPRFDEEKLDSSTLILADEIEHVPANQVGIGQFVLGDVKVMPDLDSVFYADQKMGVFFQVYNLKIDATTHKSNALVHFHVTREGQTVLDSTETSEQLKQTGDELTIKMFAPLSSFAPGKYKLELTINDQVANQNLTRSADFTVKAPVQQQTAVK